MLTRHKHLRLVPLVAVLLLMVLLPAHPALSQVGKDALQACRNGGFSTEEDFLTTGPEPPDGNPIISDGDLLSADGSVCARNADLLVAFKSQVDLGLDAVDIVDVENYLVAFSTELDDPQGRFTAGDLLTTQGAVIPNVALVAAFDVNYDIGLDALHFVGNPERIVAFLEEVKGLSRGYWLENPNALAGMLRQYNIDLWFSTEGTPPPVEQPGFLDGDLLSALGAIVASNATLLPPSVPAGIPNRGVDFGLDAATTGRQGDEERLLAELIFSTEILYDDPRGGLSFSDGDALRFGNGVLANNFDLIRAFEPRTRDVGLDALSLGPGGPTVCTPHITDFGGVPLSDIGLNGQVITGTLGLDFEQPFGGYPTVKGEICEDTTQFRVVYRPVSAGPGPGEGMVVTAGDEWWLKEDAPFLPPFNCKKRVTWSSDSNGWFDAAQYRQYLTNGCNPEIALSVWKPGIIPEPQREVQHNVWLEWQTATDVFSDTLHAALVQLDNKAPEDVRLDKQPGTCDIFTNDDMPHTVRGEFHDAHFWRYRLDLTGNGYGTVNYPDADGKTHWEDLTDQVIHTGTAGTGFVNLLPIDVHDLVASGDPVDCGYHLTLWAWDRTRVRTFDWHLNSEGGWNSRWITDGWTFRYTPSSP
jgi:hypothetical protein